LKLLFLHSRISNEIPDYLITDELRQLLASCFIQQELYHLSLVS
jgi:hypothetical protein